jgi:hypothetical protein
MDPAALEELKCRIDRAFPPTTTAPPLSLRGGNAIDDYEAPPPFDPVIDSPTNEYIESFHYGIHFLDPASWLHYLPILLHYSLSQMEAGPSAAVDTFLFSLRPPDRDSPRFGALSGDQVATVVAVLDVLGFSPGSQYQDDALQALQEYWGTLETSRGA